MLILLGKGRGRDLRQGPRGDMKSGQPKHDTFASYMMLFFGRLDAEKGWAKQLHLGALRNTNTRG